MRLFGVQVPAALDGAVHACRDHFRLAALLSAIVNILYLAPTIYMMQIYDRVIPTGGVITLLWLTIVVAFALATLALLDALRVRVMLRASLRLDNRLATSILDQSLARTTTLRGGPSAEQAMREFDALRVAVAGTPAIALFDIPWTPIYILVAFVVHPAIGALAIIASIALLAITFANERANRAGGAVALQAMSVAYGAQERIGQRSETVRALGMRRAMIARLLAERDRALRLSTKQQFDNGQYASLAKFVRLLLQSIALGLGAWLAVMQQISIGSVIAASVLISRALQPIEALVGSWAAIGQARQAIASLGAILPDESRVSQAAAPFDLPAPRGILSVKEVAVEAPDASSRPLLDNISFEIRAGEFVGIIGPSGAGKSMLARVLAGAVLPDRGIVRIDGADRLHWDAEKLALHIGYMPQDSGLLPGTIAENISRFALSRGDAPETVTQAVLSAARCAGAHGLILSLPGGYDRRIGWGAEELSAGQRQRIALARAVYEEPALLILDEPNSALDAEGEAALLHTIAAVRGRDGTVLMVTHRAPLLATASRLLLLVNGSISMFGTYKQVMDALQRPVASPALASAEVH